MDVHRFFVGWLLVAGLVGVYAQSDDKDSSDKLTTWTAPRSKYRTLDESASTPNTTNEDSSAATDVFGFVNEAGSRENLNPGGSTSPVSQEDYDWHFKKGEEVLRKLCDETNKERANREWFDHQMQSHYRRIPLNESASAPNPMNEDSSAATDVFGFVNEEGSGENLNPGGSTSPVSQEDYDWHFKKGEEVLRRLCDETNKERANREWLDPQMQSHHRRIPVKTMWDDWYPISIRDRIQAELAAFERAVFDKKEGQSITKERVPEKELIKAGPSRLETSKEKANRERLDRQMQTHGKKMLDQRISSQESIGHFVKTRMDSQQGNAESAANFASLYKPKNRRSWTPEEINIIRKEFKEYIDAKQLPSGTEIKTAINKNQLLRNRQVVSVRQRIQRLIENPDEAFLYTPKNRRPWTPEEINIIRKEFKEYIDAKKLPSSTEIKPVISKHQLLRNRHVVSVRQRIKWLIENTDEASLYKPQNHRPWTPEEINIILKEFKEYIDAKKLPSSTEIETVRNKHQLLRNRHEVAIKRRIQWHIENTDEASLHKPRNHLPWTPEENNIILKEFKEYIEAKKLPSYREIKTVRNKHQLLRNRHESAINRRIQWHIKKMDQGDYQ